MRSVTPAPCEPISCSRLASASSTKWLLATYVDVLQDDRHALTAPVWLPCDAGPIVQGAVPDPGQGVPALGHCRSSSPRFSRQFDGIVIDSLVVIPCCLTFDTPLAFC